MSSDPHKTAPARQFNLLIIMGYRYLRHQLARHMGSTQIPLLLRFFVAPAVFIAPSSPVPQHPCSRPSL
nr:MAG TPA: hypothetical protein [Caudoviricetes sp.]